MPPKASSPKVMTANRLGDGAVVYLDRRGAWVEALGEALAAGEAEAQTLLERQAEAAVRRREVVGPYLFAVTLEAGVPRPLGQRERIRAAGPTVPLPQFLEA